MFSLYSIVSMECEERLMCLLIVGFLALAFECSFPVNFIYPYASRISI